MVRVGVIGAGYLGSFHIEKFLAINECNLVGIAEVSVSLRDELKKKYSLPVYTDYRELLNKVDAVSIVVPTQFHYEIASFFIKNHIHTFIEKPVVKTVEQCEGLLSLAKEGVKIQVGHIERFNPVYKFLMEKCENPRTITMRRKSPYTERGTDVDIVFDLMIHDIDIVLSLFPEKELSIKSIVAAKVMTDRNDYVKADCEISGVSVTFEASRVHNKKERTVTVVSDNVVFEGDFINQELFFKTKEGEYIFGQGKRDILLDELRSFVLSVKEDKPVAVTLEDGCRAVSEAYRVLSFCGKSK
ncbi:MAG: Gfo/Idh/MocA family oxidoreductase [bacterium]